MEEEDGMKKEEVEFFVSIRQKNGEITKEQEGLNLVKFQLT